MPTRAASPSLTQRTYGCLRADILGGRFAPGQRLRPSELAASNGVSLNVVREALNRLAGERLVSASPQQGFAVVAILCLGFGIGLNTTIFSIVDGVLLKPFPYADPERIVIFNSVNQPLDELLSIEEFVEKLGGFDRAKRALDALTDLSEKPHAA